MKNDLMTESLKLCRLCNDILFVSDFKGKNVKGEGQRGKLCRNF